MSMSKTLRGADIRVFINGKIYSSIVSVRWSTSNGMHAIMGIDSSTPFELASSTCSVKGTFEILRIRASGGLEGAGISPPEAAVLLGKYFGLTIVDRLSDTVILQVDEAAVVDQNWTISTRSLMSGSFSFEGIGWTNEVSL